MTTLTDSADDFTACATDAGRLDQQVMQHAPGPWREEYPRVYSRDGAKLLEVNEYMCCTIHDARLMAAAPELAAALRDLVDVITGRMDGETAALHNALAALMKAGCAA